MILLHLIALPIIFFLGYLFGTKKNSKRQQSESPIAVVRNTTERNGYDRPYIPGDPGYIRGIDG